MMLNTRWIKLLRDLQMTPWRIALMLLTIALGIFVFTALLSSYSLLTREVRSNYLATNPAAARLQIDHIDTALLEKLRHYPGVHQVQAGATYKTTMSSGSGNSLPIIIFVVEDFNRLDINHITPEAGAWPPSPNSILLERDSLTRKNIHIGDELRIPLSDGRTPTLSVSGSVHDPAMPVPSYAAYGYATQSTLAEIGIDIPLSDIQITFTDKSLSTAAIEKATGELAHWIQADGYKISRISVPPAGEHPHQRIIFSVLGVFLFFSAIAFLLSTLLTATIIDGLMTKQRQQIGIMKAIGASNTQITALYLGFIFLLGVLATAVALPTGIAFGQAFTRMILGFLNFELINPAISKFIYFILIFAGTLVPLLMAAIPIAKSLRSSVQDSLNHRTISQNNHKNLNWLYQLSPIDRGTMMALRNGFRHKGRLLFILSLLASGGAMFMSSLNLQQAAQQHLTEAAAERHYDLEVYLTRANDSQKVTDIIRKIPDVNAVETWATSVIAPHRPDGLMIENTYADGGHGLLTLKAVPVASHLLSPPMEEGLWPNTIPDNTVILNRAALDSFPQTKTGDFISINLAGNPLQLKVVGIAAQKMSGRTLYISMETYKRFSEKSANNVSYRIALTHHDAKFIDDSIQHIKAALGKEHIDINYTITEPVLRHEIDAHFTMLARAIRFISFLIAIVGVFALASVMSIHVTERIREIGIMRAIGASSSTIVRSIIIEAMSISLISWIFAAALSLPLSKLASNYIGKIVFDEAFPFAISSAGIWTWLLVAATGAILASLYPAKKAVRLGIRDCFSYQ